jgi:hypothetical protein
MDKVSENPILISKELSALNAFFTAFEKTGEELRRKGIRVTTPNVAKDELGWYAVVRIQPSDKY